MTETTRFTKLPGYDTSPDVYETPEITNEASTTSQPSDTSASGSSGSDTETVESDEDGPFGGISRKRLIPDRARSRFQAVGSRVDTRGLDLSDRVDGRRKGLHVRQRRAGQQDVEEETLDAKLARLRREVEECRALAQDSASNGPARNGEVDSLGRMLAALESGAMKTEQREERPHLNGTSTVKGDEMEHETDDQDLSKIAAFDSRLSALERALGISSMDLDTTGSFTTPILPSLELLDQQVSALMTSTSIAQLDASSSRVKKLAQEAEQLAQLQAAPHTKGDSEDMEQEATIFSHEDMVKLNTLYGLLPTLLRLSPTVPALLERLKSLTALHSGAATAASELDELVKNQAGMAAELKSWEEALERLEAVVKNALEGNGRNGNTVELWVKDLQKRMEDLK